MDIVSVVSLIAASITALMYFLLRYRQMILKRKFVLLQKKLKKELSGSVSKTLAQSMVEGFPKINKDRFDYQFRELNNYLVQYSNMQTKQDIEEQVNKRVKELKQRIETIEARFPQEATLEKIATLNEAILAIKMEAMSDSIKALQDRMLTHWDIAKIVFAILSILGVLVGLVFGIINIIN